MITLATLPQATEQQVFDQVVNHLLTQKERCMVYINGNPLCVYRSKHMSCAAGCLISDEEYESFKFEKEEKNFLEGHQWEDLIGYGHVPDTHEDLIVDLQHIHDESLADTWEEKLSDYANRHGLKFNPPKA